MAKSTSVVLESASALRRYALAVISVALITIPAFALQHYGFRGVELPFYLFAVAATSWYAGVGPAALSILLSILCYDYLFTPPYFSLEFTMADLPAMIVLAAFAALITRFSATRRRIEGDLVRARDALELEVVERTQQASLLNLTHDSIFVRDNSEIITYWNLGAQELYGWTAGEAIGKSSHELLRTVFPGPLDAIRRELESSARWEGELVQTRKDGSEVVVSSRWSLKRDEMNRPSATLETNNDITANKRRLEEIRVLNDQLARRSEELEATNKELEAFAYSVSHDLRAPLRHMGGFAELLEKKSASSLDDKGRRYVANIREAAKRMGNLIDDLLAFSRIGRAEAQSTPVNLELLVREVLADMRQETAGRDIDWKIMPLPVCYGDRSMLRLVFSNLFSNAVKFTRTRPRAVIEVGCVDNSDHSVEVFVRDNGVGFDMKYANKLFGVFQRLHDSGKFEGTGIGLATVQRIIHRHGGSVRAEGAVDKGATFYFSLTKV